MNRSLFFPLAMLFLSQGSSSEIRNVSKSLSLSQGYRWDTISSSGSLTNVAVIDQGAIVLDPVSSRSITRTLNNINLWEIGLKGDVVIEKIVLLGVHVNHGIPFSQPREVMRGFIASNDSSFSHTFDNSINRTSNDKSATNAALRLGIQMRLKGPVYLTPYAGFGYDSIAFDSENSIHTYMPFYGASFQFSPSPRFEVTGFCHYNFRGERKEKMRFASHDGIIFYLPAILTKGRLSGPSLGLELDWRFARRWRLGAIYKFQQYRSANASNGGFGGECGFKTTWRTQSFLSSVSYHF